MKRCLVTGGAGFIGSHLVDDLLAQGFAVRVLDDFSSGKEANLAQVVNRIELFHGTVTDTQRVDEAVKDCDVIFHLAAIASVTKSVEAPLVSHDACATATVNVLDAARRLGVRRVIFAASSAAYGDQPGNERKEDDPLIPLSPYAAAKLASEYYCIAFTTVYGLETVRLRFFNVFGPRQDARSPYSGVIALFSEAMSQGRTPVVYGDGLQARDFVYVSDVVQALRLAANAKGAVGRVYNVGTGNSVNLLELVNHLNEILGTHLVPKHEPPRAGDVRISQANIQRARDELGYEPKVLFREGLTRLIRG